MGIPEDLTLLERNIEKLKSEYDQFFLGENKVPPHTIKTAVERLIRKYVATTIHNAALRFRYQNLVARYNSLKELWHRRMRMREEGIVIGAPRRSAFASPRRTEKGTPSTRQSKVGPIPKRKDFDATTRDPVQEKEIVDSIYKRYVQAQAQSSKPTKKVSQEGFRKLITKQVDAIKKSHKCSAVNFRVEIKDGQVKLKAKPVK